MDKVDLNVLGQELKVCGCEPLTGWSRDGFCKNHPSDFGQHTICAQVNESFLQYSRAQGNDLSSPAPEYSFPGLSEGDFWCICAKRWLQAYEDGMAPKVNLEATDQSVLSIVTLEVLRKYSIAHL